MRRSAQITILVLLLVGYGGFYLCRANLEAAGPLLLLEGMSKTSFGLLTTVATLTYGVGKMVLGASGDVLGGRRLMGLAVAGSVLFTFAFGASHAFVALVVFAAANRFFQSGGWSSVVHVVSRWFEPRKHGLVMGILATSYELGNVCALNLCGFVSRWGWRALFVVNPILFALLGGAVVLFLRGEPPAEEEEERVAKTPRRQGVRVSRKDAKTQREAGENPNLGVLASWRPSSPEREPLGVILPRLFSSGAFLTAVTLSALLTFIRIGFLTWTPTYLFEIARASGHVEVSGSIVKSSLFPAAGVVAALSVGALSDRLGPGRRAPIMAVSLAVVVALVLALAHGEARGPLAAAALIGCIGLFLLGPYSLLAGAVALDIAGKRGTATATGIIDGVGYLAGAASGYVLGRMADHVGWSAAFDVVAAAAFLATIVSGAWAVVALRSRA